MRFWTLLVILLSIISVVIIAILRRVIFITCTPLEHKERVENLRSTKQLEINKPSTIHSKLLPQTYSEYLPTLLCSYGINIMYVPFIWTSTANIWYNITQFYLKKELCQWCHTKIYGTISLDGSIVRYLEHHQRNSFRQLGHILRQNRTDFTEIIENLQFPRAEMRRATFDNVLVTFDGWIIKRIDDKYCFAVINGGCKSRDPWEARNVTLPIFDKVISIASYWGNGIWHFVMEALVGMAAISDTEKSSFFIHVNEKNSWTLNWLKFKGIPHHRIISGSINAKLLIVPEMGRCGEPSASQINWLRNIVPSTIPDSPNSVILIKRTKKRVMQKFDQVLETVTKFVNTHNMNFVLHDDSSLPSIQVQLQQFANASIVIGPHGAGMVNLISSKIGTCVIEFLPEDLNVCYTCYMRLSYFLGHHYFAIPLTRDSSIDPRKLVNSLNLCRKMKTIS